MKIGICTTDFDCMPVETLFSKIEDMGFEAVQLSFASVRETRFCADAHIEIPQVVDKPVINMILASAARHHLEIAAVNGTFNMAHPLAEVRDEGARRFEGFCKAVSGLGCPVVSLCSGTRSLISLWTYSADNMKEEALADSVECLKRVTGIAEKYDLTLAIEPEAGNVVNSPERAIQVLEAVGSDHLKMIMDCANLFHAGEARAENSRAVIAHAFDVFGDRVVLAHGKDISAGDGISFCATGEGIVDFPYFVRRLRENDYHGVMMLHGIDNEEKMVPCRRRMARWLCGE